jgi:DNA repair protein RadB
MERYSINAKNEVITSLIPAYNSGSITTLYGNAASGKTTSCLLAAIEASKHGKILYLDTESGFNTNRLKQLHSDASLLERIFLVRIKSFGVQHDTILKLHELCNNEKIKLVIVDTIGNHYRVALNNNVKEVNSMMSLQLQILTRIARDLNKVVLLTNQVSSKMNGRNEIQMVGGNMIAKMSKCIIELHKKDEIRYATLVKYKTDIANTSYYKLKKSVKFEIIEKGLILKQQAR